MFFFTFKNKKLFEADNIDSNVVLKTGRGSNNVSFSVLNYQQVRLAKSHSNDKGLACHLISATFIEKKT